MSAELSTRDRIVDVSLALFAKNGVHGTSLQMIANEMGVTKAAVYYHFRSKDGIVAAVLEPAITGLQSLVEAARGTSEHEDRVRTVVEGLADGAIANRSLYAVMLSDVAVISLVRSEGSLFREMREQLLGDNPDPIRRVKVGMFLTGLVAPAVDETLRDLSDEEIHRGIVALGMEVAG
ncbi:TetR/AcrR family transcriptional regulator [Actinomyces minihominis]|uniref:TetR/AcrR family transcriptional regulator n=1 Tax=Actinomyces minihominis TaxID=2002838 RepID=UPI000C080EC5|nr:TetR/AcrR family transcriptional regulator [Actinomyces minihominis]